MQNELLDEYIKSTKLKHKIFKGVWWVCVVLLTLSIIAIMESGVSPLVRIVRITFWLIPVLFIERDLIKRYQLDLSNPKKELLAKAAIKKQNEISESAAGHRQQMEEELRRFVDEDSK